MRSNDTCKNIRESSGRPNGGGRNKQRFVVGVSGGHIGHLSNVWMKACRRESLTDEQAMAYSVLFGWTGWTPVLMTSFMTSIRQYDVINMSSN